MQSGYSMYCFQIVIEINRKDTADHLFRVEEAGDCHMLSIFKPVHGAFDRRGQIVFIVT